MRTNKFVLALFLTLSLGFVLSGFAQQKADDTAVDPVCGMAVKKAEAKATFDIRGRRIISATSDAKTPFPRPRKSIFRKWNRPLPTGLVRVPAAEKKWRRTYASWPDDGPSRDDEDGAPARPDVRSGLRDGLPHAVQGSRD